MRDWTAKGAWLIGTIVLSSVPIIAHARTRHHKGAVHHTSTHHATTHHATAHHAGVPHAASHHEAALRHETGRHETGHRLAYRHRYAGHGYAGHGHRVELASYHGEYRSLRHHYRHNYYRGRHFHGISCVPFAREESGIHLVGDAYVWWGEAAGRYARGDVPEPGSVLNFRANRAMPLGHVAVVRAVVNSRQILVDQANWWGPGGGHGVVSHKVAVVDVSPHNDWSAVRVALGHSGNYGSVYPTYGFIYDRPEDSLSWKPVRLATMAGTKPLNPVPRDLRPRDDRTRLAAVHAVPPTRYEEVAELPLAKVKPR